MLTTDSDHERPIFPDLAREFSPYHSNQLWVADLTYVGVSAATALLRKSCKRTCMSKALAQGGRPKARYRTRNWRGYDQELIARGDLTVWISPDLAWHAAEGTGRRGRRPTFGDAAIQVVLTLKVL